MKTIEINLYSFDELSDKAKENAIEKWYEKEDYYFLSQDLKESLISLLNERNIYYQDIKLLYSLSYCQGDGLCFTGILEKNGITLKLSHKYRYYYANSVDMLFYNQECEDIEEEDERTEELKNIYFEICEILENEGYSILEYRMNDEEFSDLCDANGYYFTEDGIMKNY